MGTKNKFTKKLFWVWPYQVGAIEEFLDAQAREGLYFAGTEGPRFIFAKGRPSNRRYQVNISDSDRDVKSKFLAAGWKYLGRRNKLQYFYTDDRSVDKIECDSREIMDLIWKIMLPYFIGLTIFFILEAYFLFFRQLVNIVGDSKWNLSGSDVGSMVIAFALTVCIFSELIRFLKFMADNHTRIRNGQWIVFGRYQDERRGLLVYGAILITAVLIDAIFTAAMTLSLSLRILGIILALLILSYLIIRFRFNRLLLGLRKSPKARYAFGLLLACLVIIMILIAIFALIVRLIVGSVDKHDHIPFGLSDLGYEVSSDSGASLVSTNTTDRGFLMTKKSYVQALYNSDSTTAPVSLEYSVYKFYTESLCEKWTKSYLSNTTCLIDEKAEEASDWGANAVYYLVNESDGSSECTLVEYDKKVYILSPNMNKADEVTKALAKE